MGKKISKRTRRAPKKPRRLTPAGRKAMARAGSRNLEVYKARVAALKAKASDDIRPRLDNFERELLADLGDAPTAAERALVTSARASYTAILLALRQLELAPGRLARARGLGASLAAHQAQLLRCLKALGLRRAAPAETLENLVSEIAHGKES